MTSLYGITLSAQIPNIGIRSLAEIRQRVQSREKLTLGSDCTRRENIIDEISAVRLTSQFTKKTVNVIRKIKHTEAVKIRVCFKHNGYNVYALIFRYVGILIG